ncbi:hypothetical protein ABZT06_45045 [Streptomyces sp. NPDC005483]|uniref:hypothetical protein n=1 Tax=Streptomyces sp. NPDC005483 TaxID=3154882 RepID=UPI0033B3BA3F
MTTPDIQQQENRRKTVTVMVDGNPVTGAEAHRAERDPGLAGIDAATCFLVRTAGRHQHSFAGRGEAESAVHDGETSVSISTGPMAAALSVVRGTSGRSSELVCFSR